jgi:hypothetical protein
LQRSVFKAIPQGFSSLNAIANAGFSRFHSDRLCSLKHLESLYTFVLADFEQYFIPTCHSVNVMPDAKKNRAF